MTFVFPSVAVRPVTSAESWYSPCITKTGESKSLCIGKCCCLKFGTEDLLLCRMQVIKRAAIHK